MNAPAPSSPRETLAARLTPPGKAALATVGVRGPAAAECVAACFVPAGSRGVLDLPLGRVVYGRWRSGPHAPLGEDLVVCRLGPEAIDVQAHGGLASVELVLDSLAQAGCRVVTWQQLVRATQPAERAEALVALAAAPTERIAALLVDQLDGALGRALLRVAELMAALDPLASDRLPNARQLVDSLLDSCRVGKFLARPARVLIVGRPNAGKSTLLNALVGYERAIVYEEPGTTRDLVTAHAAWDGWPLELIDSAGWRETIDPVEAAGVGRMLAAAGDADLLLVVRDGTEPPDADDARLMAEIDRRAGATPRVQVETRADLLAPARASTAAVEATEPQHAEPVFRVSGVTGAGLDPLGDEIVRQLVGRPPEPGAALLFTPEQVARCREVAALLSAGQHAPARMRLCEWIESLRRHEVA